MEAEAFKVWIRKVDSQNRIRLPSDMGSIIPWLPSKPGTSIGCVSFPGGHGQLRLAREGLNPDFRAKLSLALKNRGDVFAASFPKCSQFARFAATLWPITIALDSHPARIAITLPKEARELGLVPRASELAVVFGMGDLLEVWTGPLWLANVQTISASANILVAEAEEELADE